MPVQAFKIGTCCGFHEICGSFGTFNPVGVKCSDNPVRGGYAYTVPVIQTVSQVYDILALPFWRQGIDIWISEIPAVAGQVIQGAAVCSYAQEIVDFHPVHQDYSRKR